MNESIYKSKAAKIGVEIKPSKNKTKKYDAYKNTRRKMEKKSPIKNEKHTEPDIKTI